MKERDLTPFIGKLVAIRWLDASDHPRQDDKFEKVGVLATNYGKLEKIAYNQGFAFALLVFGEDEERGRDYTAIPLCLILNIKEGAEEAES